MTDDPANPLDAIDLTGNPAVALGQFMRAIWGDRLVDDFDDRIAEAARLLEAEAPADSTPPAALP